MKNIHILPTNKTSRLYEIGEELYLSVVNSEHQYNIGRNIYITSDSKIEDEDWVYNIVSKTKFKATKQLIDLINDPNVILTTNKKIILTTDQELIKDGVQAIDDEFLEWFVKNSNCNFVKTKHIIKEYVDDLDAFGYDVNKYKIIIPKEESMHLLFCCKSLEECHCGKYPKQETIEEAAEAFVDYWFDNGDKTVDVFIAGAKWQEERMYSEEEVYDIVAQTISRFCPSFGNKIKIEITKEWFEQFKKK